MNERALEAELGRPAIGAADSLTGPAALDLIEQTDFGYGYITVQVCVLPGGRPAQTQYKQHDKNSELLHISPILVIRSLLPRLFSPKSHFKPLPQRPEDRRPCP